MTGADWAAAAFVFAAVALGVIALALFWEGIRGFQRQRAAARALKRIETGPIHDSAEVKKENLLRDGEGEAHSGFLGILLTRLPHRADLQQKLEQAGLRWGVATFLMLSLGLGLGLGLAAFIGTRNLIIFALFAAVGLSIPWFYVRYKRGKRIAAFEELFPEALDLLTRSIRAGHAFNTGLKVVAEESEEPLRGEFRQIYEEQRFGLPIDESLLGLADRIDLVDVRLFVTSVLIQREAGGNLAEKLHNLSTIIRARFKFRRQVKIHTAHGRMTGTVIGIAPFVATLFLYLVNPDYMAPLFTEPTGRIMIAGALISMTLGFIFIRRIVDIEF
ncbi:MAG: type II secretion system F family protein [Gemmatimonadota bacterium]